MPKDLDIATKTRVKILPIAMVSLVLAGGIIGFAALTAVTKGSKDYELLVKSFQNLSAMDSVSMKMDFTMKPEAREKNTPVLEFPAEAKELKSAYQNMFKYLPADFLFSFYMQSTADSIASKSFEESNSHVSAGGNISFGGTQFSADGEVIKLKDDYYFNIHKAPYFFLGTDLTAIQNKWVRFQLDDINYGSSYLLNFNEKSDKKFSDYYSVFSSAIDERFITIQKNTPKEKSGSLNHYIISFDYSRYPAFIRSLKTKLGEEYAIDGNFEILKSLEEPKNKKAIDVFSKTQTFEIFIDPASSQIKKLVYNSKMAPPNNIKKFQGKQLRATFTMSLDKVNQKVVIARPVSAISMDEAMSYMTGKPMNEILYGHQVRNIEYMRRAIASYASFAQEGYPENLNELLKTRKQLIDSGLAKPKTPSGVSEDPYVAKIYYYDDNYSKYMENQPFMKNIPKDVYSGNPYHYKKIGNDYELVYEIKDKPMPSSTDSYDYYSYYYSYSDIKIIEGVNTADATDISREGKGRVDSDYDGLTDQEEKDVYRTDSHSKDTDRDSYYDGEEVKYGFNPLGAGKLGDAPDEPSDTSNNILEDSQAKTRDTQRIADIRQMSTLLEIEEASQPGYALAGCDWIHVDTRLCLASDKSPLFYSGYSDPKMPTELCEPSSLNVCEYSISRSDGGPGVKTNDYEICFWLERDTALLKAGLNRVTNGGVFEAGCR